MTQKQIARLVLVGLVSLGGGAGSWAQEERPEPISTQRPTLGYSPDLVPRHTAQMEVGAGVTMQRDNYTADLPESVVRYGVTSRVELRYTATDLMATRAAHQLGIALQGTDVACSVLARVSEVNRVAPKTLVLGLSAPTGGKAWSTGSFDPQGGLVWAQSRRGGYFFSEVVGANLTTLNGARRPVWTPSIAGGKLLGKGVSVVAEYAPTMLQDHSVTHLVDGGILLMRHGNAQIDLRLGWLRDAAGDHAIFGVGYSTRQQDGVKKVEGSNQESEKL